jgi:hypothetical protein
MGNKEVKVRKIFFTVCLFFSSVCLFAQEIIQAQKEILGRTTIGKGKNQVEYFSDEEGFFSPNGPFIDGNGILYFFPTYDRGCLITFYGKEFQSQTLTENIPDFNKLISTGYIFTSQEGTIGSPGNGLTFNFYDDKFRVQPFDWGEEKVRAYDYILTPIPQGMLLESQSKKVLLIAEFLKTGDIEIHNTADAKLWLRSQPEGFSIGDDGLLYRNGMLWSAVRPTDSTEGENYIGRLISGHTVWMGPRESEYRYIVIANTKGKTELKVEIPWGEADNRPLYMYDSGLGPWGELYCLLPPAFVVTGQRIDDTGEKRLIYGPPSTGTAELVVVRNYLKYFGRLNDDKVRLRKGPSTSTESLGTYPVKTGFRILEKGTAEETIGGQKNVWYKVRLLDGTEGWFFGAFVHNLYDGPDGNPPPWPNVADW